jgi:hypothetical protein
VKEKRYEIDTTSCDLAKRVNEFCGAYIDDTVYLEYLANAWNYKKPEFIKKYQLWTLLKHKLDIRERSIVSVTINNFANMGYTVGNLRDFSIDEILSIKHNGIGHARAQFAKAMFERN